MLAIKDSSIGKAVAAMALVVSLAVALVNCGGTAQFSSNPPTGTIRVSVSDPPPCKFPNGMFKHVYVSIRSVQAHTSSTAGDSAPGWQDLAPQLAQTPVQMDLLSQSATACTLGSLGSNTALPVGNYQQIRLILVPNTPGASDPKPAANSCGSQGFNCVVLSDDSVHQIELSSQANTGLKIPPGQVVGGPITVGDGQTVDLNIDFNTCSMLIQQGNGKFRLKPTLTAGQVSQQTSALSGQVVDSTTQQPVPNGTFIVALEQTDSTGVNHILMQSNTDANGNFTFCPLPMGTFDVVVAGHANGRSFGPTVLLGVSTGVSLAKIPVAGETAATPLGPATIMGTATASSGTPPTTTGFTADVALSALQTITLSGGGTRKVAIPLEAMNSTPVVSTAAGATCPAGTNCADYKLIVPASNPSVGTFSMGGTTFAAPAAGGVLYSVEGRTTIPQTSMTNAGAATCSPSTQIIDKDATDLPLNVLGGASVTAKRMDFTACT